MTGFPYIITFYSFKGGVGRSLALINVAFELIHRGRNVLVLDMDIEAPGISGFLSRNKELAGAFQRDAIDLLTMVVEHARQHRDPATYEAFFAAAHDDFTMPIADEKLSIPSIRPRLGMQGRLDVIGVRQDGDFCSRLADLGLGNLNNDDLGLTGNALRAYLKTRSIKVKSLPGLERGEPKPVPYDYVLVDARTGVTDAGGLSIGPLTDRLVVLTGLNDQNVIGTRDFLKEIGLKLREWFTEDGDAPWDAAHAPPRESAGSPRGLGPKPTLIVASPVPGGEIELRQGRFKEVEREIGPVGTWIPYHPRLGVIETIFVRDYPDEHVSYQYRKLTDLVLAGVGDHPTQLASDAATCAEPASELDLLLRVASAEAAMGETLLQQFAIAHDKQLGEADLARLYATLTLPGATEDHVGFGRWGIALAVRARAERGEQANRLFEQAYQKYEAALRVKPNKYEALNNWGIGLAAQAKIKKGKQADRLFEQAYQKYDASLKIKPGKHETLSNWGAALAEQAKTKDGEQADRLFEQAYQKFEAALKIKPDKHEVLGNWGAALAEQAKKKQGDQADHLFEQAYQKFEAALRIKPDKHEALSNWGAALSDQARQKQDGDRVSLLAQATERLAAGENLSPGSCAFNLACCASLRGNPEECRQWLQTAAKHGRLTPEELKDADLDSVRHLPWFKELQTATK